MRWLNAILPMVLATGFLAACGTTPVRLPDRTVTEVGTRMALYETRNTSPWCVYRYGYPSRIAAPNDNEVIAGFHNIYHPGAQPFPCDAQISQIYAGVVRFDLSDLRGKIVESAVLRFDRRDTGVPIRTERRLASGGVEDLRTCATMLEVSTEPVITGYLDGNHDDPNMTVNSVPMRSASPVTVENGVGIVGVGHGVTSAVQDWVLGRRPNSGFVLKPRPQDVGKNNNSCTGYFFNPRLEITILDRVPEGT